MTKEALISRMLSLPVIEMGRIPRDREIIEGNQGAIHYKMTRVRIPPLGNLTVFSMSVSGPRKDRLAFIDQVAQELGRPLDINVVPGLPGIHFVFWKNQHLRFDSLKHLR